MDNITPDIVREYKEFTPKFLCGLKANIFNIRFRKFKVRNSLSFRPRFPRLEKLRKQSDIFSW